MTVLNGQMGKLRLRYTASEWGDGVRRQVPHGSGSQDWDFTWSASFRWGTQVLGSILPLPTLSHNTCLATEYSPGESRAALTHPHHAPSDPHQPSALFWTIPPPQMTSNIFPSKNWTRILTTEVPQWVNSCLLIWWKDRYKSITQIMFNTHTCIYGLPWWLRW